MMFLVFTVSVDFAPMSFFLSSFVFSSFSAFRPFTPFSHTSRLPFRLTYLCLCVLFLPIYLSVAAAPPVLPFLFIASFIYLKG